MAYNDDQRSIYHPLDKTKRQIRLMRMFHDRGPEIDCELSIFSLDDNRTYDALSYCWAKERPICQIRLNGTPFNVRPNLFAYLELMREEQQTCWIFIDALCINQEDVAERSVQVGLMGTVYHNAQKVTAWLGSGLPPNNGLSTLFQETCRSEESIAQLFEDSSNKLGQNQLYVLILHHFLKLGYWSRVWIVQEIALARKLIFRSGRLSVEACVLFEFLHDMLMQGVVHGAQSKNLIGVDSPIMRGYLQSFKQQRHEIKAIWLAHGILHKRQNSQTHTPGTLTLSLSSAVKAFSSQDSTEMYDKIYGVLGLTRSQLRPDYGAPALELYARVFVEGILEIPGPPVGMSKEDPMYLDWRFWYAGFQEHLLHALNLKPHHPTVALVSSCILELCVPAFDRSMAEVSLRDGANLREFSTTTEGRWPLATLVSRIRGRLTKLRIEWSKAQNHRLLTPGNNACYKTYGELVQMVTQIFMEVQHDVQPRVVPFPMV